MFTLDPCLVLNNHVGKECLLIICEIEAVAYEAIVLMTMCSLDICIRIAKSEA